MAMRSHALHSDAATHSMAQSAHGHHNGSVAGIPPGDEDTIVEGRALEVHFASLEEKKRIWWRNAIMNMIFIAAWFFFATVLSVYNKWMFSADYYGFPYPLFVTALHMAIQWMFSALVLYFVPSFRIKHKMTIPTFSRKVLPTGFTSALDIGMSNLSLQTITLSFYTMVKSSSLVFVLFFAFLFRLEVFSFRLVGVISLIVSGVLLMVATETHFVLSGFILVLSGSALGGLRWSLTQILLRDKEAGLNHPATTMYWLAPVMGVSLAIISMIHDDWFALFSGPFFSGMDIALKTCFFLVAPGVLAFCMVMSEFYILQRAGVVPMSIAGIAKEVTTISVSAWFFGDLLTPLNITGVVITTCGIVLFTYHKYRKSIDSTVPLDAHGNPISSNEILGDDLEHHPVSVEEMQPLADPSVESNDYTDHSTLTPHRSGPDILFDMSTDDADAKSLSSQFVRDQAHRISLDMSADLDDRR